MAAAEEGGPIVTKPRARAIGAIGPGAVKRLEAAGLAVVDFEELCQLKLRRDELEQDLRRLEQAQKTADVRREALVQ